MLERELLVALEAGYGLAPDQVALLERAEEALRRASRGAIADEPAAPEDAAHDGGVDERRPLVRR